MRRLLLRPKTPQALWQSRAFVGLLAQAANPAAQSQKLDELRACSWAHIFAFFDIFQHPRTFLTHANPTSEFPAIRSSRKLSCLGPRILGDSGTRGHKKRRGISPALS